MESINEQYTSIWNKALEIIKERRFSNDETVFNTFFTSSYIYEINKNYVTICVKDYINKTIMISEIDLIQETLSDICEREMVCAIVLVSELNKLNHQEEKKPTIKTDISTLNPNYTFDNFIIGKSNKESHSAALAAALQPGKFFNPLFIYGDTGLGKTHLLNAVGNYINNNNPKLKVLYITSYEFVNQVSNSIKSSTIDKYKEDLANVDVFLIDDIQFLSGKEKSNEIFFHIFNELVNNRKQIIITSDRPPNDIRGIEDRLVSRFVGGLTVVVDSPEYETAVKLIKNISDDNHIEMDDIVIEFIANNYSSNFRLLEGTLNRLLFGLIDNNEERITLDLALNILKEKNKKISIITTNNIKKIVNEYFGLSKGQIESKNRTKTIVNARHIAIYLCRKHLDIPYTKIGEEFGNRDHSTIMSSFDKIDKGIKINNELKHVIIKLESLLNK
ncbi:MAG: chromosomal replication initiator protein DnaA [Erysipelotrichaceae bacterium]